MQNEKALKILLVNPPQGAAYGKMRPPSQMHMGLAYIGAVLENSGHRVEIADMDAEGVTPGEFEERIKNGRYDITGFTATTPTFLPALELANRVKKNSPGTIVIFGGMHPTIMPQETITHNAVDIVVKGEGEITFKEIAERVRDKRGFAGVNGILYKKDGSLEETAARDLVKDLDALPFPARHLFKNKAYTYPDALYRETAPIITSRGCPGMCTYCNAHSIFKRVFRMRSAKNIADEIEFLIKNMRVKEIHIWDDNFTTVKKRVFELRDEILKRKIRVKFAFPNGIRADFLDKDIIDALKEMGTYSIAVGVESGSQKVLDKARKGVKLERVEEAFRLAKKAGLETWAFFMIGLPGEDEETIKETIRFVKKIKPDIAKFHILKPYPGTEVYETLRSRGFILTKDYNMFGIHTPPVHRLESLTSSDMVKWQKKAYAKFYLNPATILRQALRVKTFNRLILNFKTGVSLLKMVSGD